MIDFEHFLIGACRALVMICTFTLAGLLYFKVFVEVPEGPAPHVQSVLSQELAVSSVGE